MKIQPSTIKGLSLIGSVIAAATGYGHLFSLDLSHENSIQFGGVIGLAVPFVIGAYEAIRDEFKNEKEQVISILLTAAISVGSGIVSGSVIVTTLKMMLHGLKID